MAAKAKTDRPPAENAYSLFPAPNWCRDHLARILKISTSGAQVREKYQLICEGIVERWSDLAQAEGVDRLQRFQREGLLDPETQSEFKSNYISAARQDLAEFLGGRYDPGYWRHLFEDYQAALQWVENAARESQKELPKNLSAKAASRPKAATARSGSARRRKTAAASRSR